MARHTTLAWARHPLHVAARLGLARRFHQRTLRFPVRQPLHRLEDEREPRLLARHHQHRQVELLRERVNVDHVEARKRDALQQHRAHVREVFVLHQAPHHRRRVGAVFLHRVAHHDVEPRATAHAADEAHAPLRAAHVRRVIEADDVRETTGPALVPAHERAPDITDSSERCGSAVCIEEHVPACRSSTSATSSAAPRQANSPASRTSRGRV